MVCQHVPRTLSIPCDDILRHSTLDNYWCYVYERLVKYYKHQTTNQKNVAKTFATRAAQERFVKLYLAVHDNSKSRKDSQPLDASSSDKCLTISAAFSLKQQLSEDNSTCSKERLSTGILIGSGKILELSPQQLADIKFWMQHKFPKEDAPQVAYVYSKVLITNDIGIGTVYRVGDVIAIQDVFASNSEWVMELRTIISYGPIEDQYYTFVDGEYYVPQTLRGSLVLEDWTQLPKLMKWTYANLCVQKSGQVRRKLMLYPDPHRNSSFFVALDTENYVSPTAVVIPPYPIVGKVVVTDHSSRLYVVQSVNSVDHTFRGIELKQSSCRQYYLKTCNQKNKYLSSKAICHRLAYQICQL